MERAQEGGLIEFTSPPTIDDRPGPGVALPWKRPTAYLEPSVRANISTFSKFSADDLESGLSKLQADIEAGGWQKKYSALNHFDELDLGYRLIIGRP